MAKNDQQLIDLIIDFANEPNPKRRGALTNIFGAAYVQGLMVKYLAKVDDAAALQTEFIKMLDWMVEHGFSADLTMVQIACSGGLSVGKPLMLFSNDGPDVLGELIAFLLFVERCKGVKKCPACHKFFVVKKFPKQITCNRTCKTRLRRKKMSDEDKAALKDQRIKKYRDHILNGGKK